MVLSNFNTPRQLFIKLAYLLEMEGSPEMMEQYGRQEFEELKLSFKTNDLGEIVDLLAFYTEKEEDIRNLDFNTGYLIKDL